MPKPPFNSNKPLHYINAKQFFRHYAPTIRNAQVKVTGQHSIGSPAVFTEADRAAISAGLKALFADIEKSL